MNFNKIFEDKIQYSELTEAVSKKWKRIIENPDKIVDGGYASDKGRLDLTWYGECNGCINYGMNQKGTLYKIKHAEWMFYTFFNTKNDLTVVYTDAEGSIEDQEDIKLTTLTKMMVKAKAWEGKPIHINNTKTSKYVTFQKGTKWASEWEFVFDDGMTVTASIYRDDEPAKAKASIMNKIQEIEGWGYKIAKKVQPDLERLLPHLFGDTGFSLNKTVWLNASKIDKTAEFQQFINSMDSESRTGCGIKILSTGIRVHGMVGNMSSGYESEGFDWKKKPNTLTEFKKFMKTSGAIKYIISLQKAMHGESKAYADYMANGGAID